MSLERIKSCSWWFEPFNVTKNGYNNRLAFFALFSERNHSDTSLEMTFPISRKKEKRAQKRLRHFAEIGKWMLRDPCCRFWEKKFLVCRPFLEFLFLTFFICLKVDELSASPVWDNTYCHADIITTKPSGGTTEPCVLTQLHEAHYSLRKCDSYSRLTFNTFSEMSCGMLDSCRLEFP